MVNTVLACQHVAQSAVVPTTRVFFWQTDLEKYKKPASSVIVGMLACSC